MTLPEPKSVFAAFEQTAKQWPERDFLEASESLIETLRSSEIQKYSYLQLIGELGDTFQIILE